MFAFLAEVSPKLFVKQANRNLALEIEFFSKIEMESQAVALTSADLSLIESNF